MCVAAFVNMSQQHVHLILCILAFVIGMVACTHTLPPPPKDTAPAHPYVDTDTIVTLIFAGDMMGHTSQFTTAWNQAQQCYDYKPCFRFVKGIVSAADLACVNLEMPLKEGHCSTFPIFCSPPAVLDGLQSAGFDLLFMANNHVVDQGQKGLESTIREIKQRNLLFTGAALDTTQRDSISPLIAERKGLKIAFLNYTYGTNGMPVHAPNIINVSNREKIVQDIRRADSLGAQVKIMYIHWGVEYQHHSHAGQQELAQFLADNGVDLIIGGHPHVVQEVDTLYGKVHPVVCYYSLGNFLSNQRQQYCNESILVKVDIHKKSGKILSTSYIPLFSYRGTYDGIYQHYSIPTYDYHDNSDYFHFEACEDSKIRFAHQHMREQLSTPADSAPSPTTPLHYIWTYPQRDI